MSVNEVLGLLAGLVILAIAAGVGMTKYEDWRLEREELSKALADAEEALRQARATIERLSQ